MHKRSLVVTMGAAVAASLALQACTNKDTGSAAESDGTVTAAPQQVRGTIQSVDSTGLVVSTANGPVRVDLPAKTPMAAVVPSDRSHITDGSFLGIGSATQPDGSQRAVEITVFPEALRGTGEGSYPWNHPGASDGSKMTNGTAGSLKMTNGTVASSRMTNGTVASQQGSSSLTLSYKSGTSGGSQTITIPPDVPIVSLETAQPGDLQPGAHVIVFATRGSTGALTAARVLVGKNGLVPPQ
jgi:hypothetical protein